MFNNFYTIKHKSIENCMNDMCHLLLQTKLIIISRVFFKKSK